MNNQFKRQARFTIIFLAVLVMGIFVSCDDYTGQKIPMSAATGSLETLISDVDNEIAILVTPRQFYVSEYFSPSEIQLSWDKVPNADTYIVERVVVTPVNGSWKEPDEIDWRPLSSVSNNSYVDKILSNPALNADEYNNKYFYRVKASNPAEGYDESSYTQSKSAMLFKAASGLSASGGTLSYVELRWVSSPGATRYEIYRNTSPTGTYTSLGTVSGKTVFQDYTADKGNEYYYKITAKNRFNIAALETAPGRGFTTADGAPGAPTNVRLASNSGRGHSKDTIKIEWDKSPEDGAQYAVYRSTTPEGANQVLLNDNVTLTNFTDTTAGTGVYYFYQVQTITNKGKSGLASSPESFVLSPPSSVDAEKDSNGDVTVSWQPAIGNASEQSQYTYKVYASTSSNGNFSLLSASPFTVNGLITVTGLSASNTHFKVVTVKSGVDSDPSVAVSAPLVEVGFEVTQYANIAGEAANGNNVYPVKITWRKPEKDAPTKYYVQRASARGTDFSGCEEIVINAGDSNYYDEGTGVYTYIDRNASAKPREKFYYRVLFLDKGNHWGREPMEKAGWGAITHTQYILEYAKTMNNALGKLTYMWKTPDTSKIGSETKNGAIGGGTIYYNAKLINLGLSGAEITILLTNYADHYVVDGDSDSGVYFMLNGNSNTKTNMSANGNMSSNVACTGMYPGRVYYDKITITKGAAAGGTYGVDIEGFGRVEVPYTVMPVAAQIK